MHAVQLTAKIEDRQVSTVFLVSHENVPPSAETGLDTLDCDDTCTVLLSVNVEGNYDVKSSKECYMSTCTDRLNAAFGTIIGFGSTARRRAPSKCFWRWGTRSRRVGALGVITNVHILTLPIITEILIPQLPVVAIFNIKTMVDGLASH